VLAAEHLLELGLLDRAVEGVQGGAEVLLDVLAAREPVGQDLGVVLLAREAGQQRDVVLDALAALQDPLGLGLVLPELRLGGLFVETGELGFEFPPLKDSRECPRPSRPVARNAG
jgi:hypothetical protein